MNVTGPNWPSTAALREALAGLESPLTLRWGAGGKNGLEQLAAFQAAGLNAPEFTTSVEQAKTWVRSGLKVYGRRLHHTQANDIVGPGFKAGGPAQTRRVTFTTRKGNRVTRLREVPASRERFNPEWLRRDFWVKVLPIRDEYRQHIFDGHAIRVGKKVQTGPQTRVQPVRSRKNGWHLDYGWKATSEEFTNRIRETAKGAVAALGYLSGAVDIVEGQDGKLYVLEVNSAPSLRDANTLGAYIQAITRWVKREAKRSKEAGTVPQRAAAQAA